MGLNIETTCRVVSEKTGRDDIDETMVPDFETTRRVVPENTIETTRRVVSTTIQPNSLGSIIGQYKSICTKRIRAINYPQFEWQTRYYDHIVRDEAELNRIRAYIRNNPGKWTEERYG